MKAGCIRSLVIFILLLAGYYAWLSPKLDPPALWIVTTIVALVATGALGAIYNAYLVSRDLAAVNRAASGLPLRDGRAAAVGTIEPAEKPLTAPLSGTPCALYEYKIASLKRVLEGESTVEKWINDFAGVAMTACVVRSPAGNISLYGFPDIDSVPEQTYSGEAMRQRAKEVVKTTNWQDCTGLKAIHGVRSMMAALTSADRAIRHDWRVADDDGCDWLRPPVLADDGVTRIEPDDYYPRLTEKLLAPGDAVVAIGRYDSTRGGLVASAIGTGLPLRLIPGDGAAAARKLRMSVWRQILGGLIALALIHGFLPDAIPYIADFQAARTKDKLNEKQREFTTAVRNSDVEAVGDLLEEGVDVNAPTSSDGKTALMETRDPEIAKLLIEHGANVNALDNDGHTALMFAARGNNAAILRLLIAAGADLNIKNYRYQTTALIDATSAEHNEAVEVLRAAGAIDDRVTAANGKPIPADHPAFAVCRDYLRAIYAADAKRLHELSTRDRPLHLDGVDWKTWRTSRPADPQLSDGFVRGDDATIAVAGVGEGGYSTTWEFQLRREQNQWRILRERWVVKGLR